MSGTAVERPPSTTAETLARIRARLVQPLPADGWWGWAIPLAIAGVALLMRLWRITRPPSKVFDETYYAPDAWNLLHHGVELDTHSRVVQPGFVVHPPLGKWAIALGEWAWGNHPLGWRFSAAIAGSLAVLMMARIARRLFRSTLLGCIAGLLMAFDGLEFVQSRTSMLDIFLMFWVLAAFGCLLLDRDQGRRRLAEKLEAPLELMSRGPWLGLRPWRWACGFCLGAAFATKWDGAFWVPAFLVLAVFWDAGARRVAGARQPFVSALLLDGLFALVPLVVLVAAVYLVAWTGWFVSDGLHAWDHDRYVQPGQSWFAHDHAVLGGWWHYQWEMWNFHRHLDAAHPYLSRPYGWLLLARPVSYFYATPTGCGAASCSQEVLAIGTPALWWAVIPAFIAVIWRTVARLDWRAAAILISFLSGYLPWFYADHDHRTMFLFYMLADLPFMVLGVTMALGMVLGHRYATTWRHAVGTVVVGAYLIAVVGTFGYLYPVLSGKVLTYDQWHQRMWLHSCNADKNRNEHHENAPCWI